MWAVPKPGWSLERCWVGGAKAELGLGSIWARDAEGSGIIRVNNAKATLGPGGLAGPSTSAQPGWRRLSTRRDAPQHPGAGLL